MGTLVLMVFGPLFAGLILALAWWAIWGRRSGLHARAAAGFSVAAGLVVILGDMAADQIGLGGLMVPLRVPNEVWFWYYDYRATIALGLGIVAVLLLAFPIRSHVGLGSADLSQRTLLTFTRGRWFILPAVTLALILVLTIAAGLASEPDDEGHYRRYVLHIGGPNSMSNDIYGWYFSAPALILIAVLLVGTIIDLALVARPALGKERDQETRERTTRSRNIIALTTGVLILHLGSIFDSLAATASMRGNFGSVRVWTTFSALQPALQAASLVCAALGAALVISVILSAIPSRRRENATTTS